ncbi:uncharacterized protein LOC128215053 [Mya arenaria]|uniref:uncharacterized protein LOC128215053 n=1 Tax=Mya arenaria TaxID=6604 RepID=UPI0022DF7792|nr:uncharacterized protein LOC128215053 [Mya arenaria]
MAEGDSVPGRHLSLSSDEELDPDNIYRCRSHQHTHPIEYYCNDHKEMCCVKEAFDGHRPCKTTKIGELHQLEPELVDLPQAISRTERICFQSVTMKANEKLARENLNRQLQEKIQNIERLKKTIMEQLDAAKEDFQAVAARETKEGTLNKLDHMENISTFLDLSHSVSQGSDVTKKAIISLYLRDKAQEAKQNMFVNFEMEHTRQINMTVNRWLNRALTETTLLTFNSKPMPVSSVQFKLSVSILLRADGRWLNNEPLISGLDFISQQRILAVDNRNYKLILLNADLTIVNVHTFDRAPVDVVVIGNSAVVSIPGYQILEVFDITRDNRIVLKAHLPTISQYSSLCKFDDTSIIGCVLHDKNFIRKVTFCQHMTEIKENILRTPFPAKKFKISEMYCGYDQEINRLIVTDKQNAKVYIHDRSDDSLQTLIEKRKLVSPQGVAIGPFWNTYVCSEQTNSLLQFLPSGELLDVHPLNVKFPHVLRISDDRGKMLISNRRDGQRFLQVYDIVHWPDCISSNSETGKKAITNTGFHIIPLM